MPKYGSICFCFPSAITMKGVHNAAMPKYGVLPSWWCHTSPYMATVWPPMSDVSMTLTWMSSKPWPRSAYSAIFENREDLFKSLKIYIFSKPDLCTQISASGSLWNKIFGLDKLTCKCLRTTDFRHTFQDLFSKIADLQLQFCSVVM